MQSRDLEEQVPAFSRLSGAIPRADFVRNLRLEIGQAARRRMGYATGMPFEETVIELRKLVRLLCETLVPLQSRLAFRQNLGRQLQARAIQAESSYQQQWRWLMIGSVLGSLLSLLGVLTALLLRRRQTRLHTDKRTAGVA